MKKYLIIATLALALAGCEDYSDNRYPITKVGNDIYLTWCSEINSLNIAVNLQTFNLNKMLQAETQEQADSIHRVCFENDGYHVIKLEDTVYQIQNNHDGYAGLCFLVKTDGNDLNVPGTKWTIVFNLPHDFQYQAVSQKAQTSYSAPYEPYRKKIAGYADYLPMTITCTAPDTWQWENATTDAEKLNDFSIDCTVRRNTVEIVPGIISGIKFQFNGKGHFLARTNTFVDYEMVNIECAAQTYPFRCEKGNVELVVTNNEYDQKPAVSAVADYPRYTITYCGVTEEYEWHDTF